MDESHQCNVQGKSQVQRILIELFHLNEVPKRQEQSTLLGFFFFKLNE